ncbi:Small secreted domain [Venturia nashicola]|uniref:Small secreted domain n=1 Tax=Venturia nashicola TaxID=86259 RepID=A0A4Z1NRC3_9PEZI|nr:Small secreted domain [Venturia nashicola]
MDACGELRSIADDILRKFQQLQYPSKVEARKHHTPILHLQPHGPLRQHTPNANLAPARYGYKRYYQSPGSHSGNQIQIPIHIPINVCGITVNVIGLLNPAFGNACANNKLRRGLSNALATVSVFLEGKNWIFSVPVGVPFDACGKGFDGSAVAQEMAVECGVGLGVRIG